MHYIRNIVNFFGRGGKEGPPPHTVQVAPSPSPTEAAPRVESKREKVLRVVNATSIRYQETVGRLVSEQKKRQLTPEENALVRNFDPFRASRRALSLEMELPFNLPKYTNTVTLTLYQDGDPVKTFPVIEEGLAAEYPIAFLKWERQQAIARGDWETSAQARDELHVWFTHSEPFRVVHAEEMEEDPDFVAAKVQQEYVNINNDRRSTSNARLNLRLAQQIIEGIDPHLNLLNAEFGNDSRLLFVEERRELIVPPA